MTGKERLLRQFRKLQEVEVAIHKVTDWEPLTFEGYKSASEYFQDFQSLSKFEASLLDLLANTEYESARRLMYTLKTELEYLTDGYKGKEEYLDNINANEIFDDMIKQLINHIDSGADNIRTVIKGVPLKVPPPCLAFENRKSNDVFSTFGIMLCKQRRGIYTFVMQSVDLWAQTGFI